MASTGSTGHKSFCMKTVDYAEQALVLLPAYMSYVENNSSTFVKLTDRSGRWWDVVVQKLNGREFITDGWCTFAGEIGLKSGQYMVFTEVSITTLLVQMYDSQLIERNVVIDTSCGYPENKDTHISFCKHLLEEYHTDFIVDPHMIPQAFVSKNVLVTYLRGVRLEAVARDHTDNWLTKFDILRFEMQADMDRWEVWAYNAFGSEKLGGPVTISELMHEWRINHRLYVKSQFVREMTQNTINGKLEIPKKFAQTTGITAKSYVELRMANGNVYAVPGRYQVKCHKNMRLFMYLGWQQFIRSNNIRIGNVLLFTYIPGSNNVIAVDILEKTEGRNMIGRADKGGWLPFP
ncbi:hypothetical protein C2S53_018455 [Perilla frutescens var. hirtella]|uniref:TF-B3 domain-containing protein n=1 Tax=Perilla frutescens var. hirtella TaxID=608512 RepID=A0AAD4J0X1_PERFH|nr:hypothetical protein C2S53_018455 [Perilla frutescens var. hirtella]